MPYPVLDAYAGGYLTTPDGQQLWWAECGIPTGRPVVVLHGGPGSGCSAWLSTLFDPQRHRIVLLDQRGAGRSRPHASSRAARLQVNTTEHLVADLELLRRDRGITRWSVFGVSWGATLASAYIQRHRSHVVDAVLAAVTMTRPSEVHWLTRGVARFFPEQWQRFRDFLPEADRDGNLAAGYARLLASDDDAVQAAAAQAWCDWEQALVSAETDGRPDPRYDDPAFRVGFARLVTHYFAHAAWLAPEQLLTGARELADVPAVLIHGRADIGSPLQTAWDLHRAWPGSRLVVSERAGHVGGDLAEHIVQATDGFARKRRP